MSAKALTWILMLTILITNTVHPAISALPQACEYWVAPVPAGSDSNPGTFSQPWATLDYASAHVPDNNCIVWFKNGIYTGSNELHERFQTLTTFKAINPYQAILQYSGAVIRVKGTRNMVFEGFELRHTGPGAGALVVYVERNTHTGLWAENITFRNNIFHDSYNDDLLKILDGARFVTVENNIFYNQEGPDQHIDVNSVTDVVIQDNIFFNDFAGSGRSIPTDTKAYIVIKDSNGDVDGLVGSERITVRRNIFLNWEGGSGETLLQVGNDGKPYYEAQDVRFENNLIIGNAHNQLYAALGVAGAKNITFTNNTVVGDLPSSAYAFWMTTKDLNPQNQNIYFYNNIWSDPTGSMGADVSGGSGQFSVGHLSQTNNLRLDNNLYWNGGAPIPPGDLASPLVDDAHRVMADPLLNTDQASVILPRWNGSTFLSGNTSIRQEFLRLADQYGKIPTASAAIGLANQAFAPSDDILGRRRSATPDLGAYEYRPELTGADDLTTIWLSWSDPHEPNATNLAISYTLGTSTLVVSGIPTATRAYKLTGLLPYSFYSVTLTARSDTDAILSESNTLLFLTTDKHVYLPVLFKNGL